MTTTVFPEAEEAASCHPSTTGLAGCGVQLGGAALSADVIHGAVLGVLTKTG